MRVRSVESEADELFARSVKSFDAALKQLVRAIARDQIRPTTSLLTDGRVRAIECVQGIVGESMALADLLGRRRLLLEVDAIPDPGDEDEVERLAETPVVPRVPFSEAIRNIASREPRLASTAKEVAELYRERHAFALARSASEKITIAVQREVSRSIAAGLALPSVEKVIADLGDFRRSYAETVYRTNINTAYTAGRFQQAQDPNIRKVIGGFQFVAVQDSDVRRGRKEDQGENHAAAHGMIASQDDPIWRVASPPCGYNCRCKVRMVSRFELERLGLIQENGEVTRKVPSGFSNFRPHPDFATRSDDRVYGLQA